jgi:hypothetical protein
MDVFWGLKKTGIKINAFFLNIGWHSIDKH